MMETLMNWWEIAQPVFWPTLWIVVLTVILILSVAYLTLWERKLIGWMQVRKGPNRVRIFGLPGTGGLGQPFADVIKLVIKEIIVPSQSNKILFRLAPAITSTHCWAPCARPRRSWPMKSPWDSRSWACSWPPTA
jgi:NADH:ubiquinone oxidoreductase subunit H